MMGYGRGYGYGYGNMMGGGGWFIGLLLLLFAAVVVVVIVLLIIWALRAAGRHDAHTMHSMPGGPMAEPGAPAGGAGHHEAVGIAKKRLASGEITKEQYDEIMRALDGR
jgi:uncharacterized membrane protein